MTQGSGARRWPGWAIALVVLAPLVIFWAIKSGNTGILGYGFFLLCPLMHLFMGHHHGEHDQQGSHNHGGSHDQGESNNDGGQVSPPCHGGGAEAKRPAAGQVGEKP